MKIVCVHIPGSLREETLHAINTLWPWVREIIEINKHDQMAYGRILYELWERGNDFWIVEPDIVIRPDVVDTVLTCGCEYGAYPYAWLTDVGPALGCTWFRSSFIKRYPNAMKMVVKENVTWRQLDVVLMRHVLVREYSQQPHVHLPPVQHLNNEKQLLPEANHDPMMLLPAW